MKILVIASESLWNELTATSPGIEWQKVNNAAESSVQTDVDAIFDLSENISIENYNNTSTPVFINSVSQTLTELNANTNVIRLNGWSGFVARTTWELSGIVSEAHRIILSALNKKIIVIKDQPGFVSARIISMIINEAFYAKGENISTENEIDIAMKLGTNYPKGPFEWANQIGIKNVYLLLEKLSKTDSRYLPSSLLQKKAAEQ